MLDINESKRNVVNVKRFTVGKDFPAIKRINGDTVHKICSGQVVLNLAIGVKELVENAIDAGATNIEIKLKEYGSELIEVIDNGSGVLEQNFDVLTLKHYTSKLTEFADLESVETLGFRGEALSSLCALSDVIVTTRHHTTDIATKIEYDHNGKIIKKTISSRPKGTTVALANIFSTLPVRRKEFLKNLKREFNKMCQLLYAYCLVSVNVKITCTNQVKNARTVVMATQASCSTRENIINVFGAKQISSLIDIALVKPSEAVLEEYGLKMGPNEKIPFSFECFLSSVTHGNGRNASDRQFYYINSRPCEPTNVMKLVNQIYKQFNGNQYPFVYLNVLIDRNHTDINVSPDKRQIFLDNEKLLLCVLKSSLLDAFKHFPSTYPLQNLNIAKCVGTKGSPISKTSKRAAYDDSETAEKSSLFAHFDKKMKKTEFDEEKKLCKNENTAKNSSNFSIYSSVLKNKDESMVDLNEIKNHKKNCVTTIISEDPNPICIFKQQKKDIITNNKLQGTNDFSIDSSVPKSNDGSCINYSNSIVDLNEMENHKNCATTTISEDSTPVCTFKQGKKDIVTNNKLKESKVYMENPIPTNSTQISNVNKNVENHELKVSVCSQNGPAVVLNNSIALLERSIERKMHTKNCGNNISVKFKSQINPNSNKDAEQELQKQITKDKFKEMDIIGQFNLSFIITQLEDDLFIIDQHASDEKYNFEQLQMNTVLETQTLVRPMPLHLTVVNENLLIENEDKFKKNGFIFSIDNTAAPTKKASLTAMPISKNYLFGKDDIDELLFMLQEGNETVCRPSRVKQMLASRACRKSVMVGKALTQTHMRKLIDHMGEIDQPWNCPHGRPTMRHLVNLHLLQEI